eukprot:2603253-Prymnesium_polylepis.1
MKRSRGNLSAKRKNDQDEALAAVLADLEAEHGTPQPVLAPRPPRPPEGASSSTAARMELAEGSNRVRSRRETAFDAPPGFTRDEATGFWFSAEQ